MQNKIKNYNRSKPEILRLLWDIIVFRLVTNYTKLYTYEFSCNFDTVLYKFLETGTSDRCPLGIVQNLRTSVPLN